MRKLLWPALFIFLILLQGALWLICPSWPSFDLLLPTIYFFALLYGEWIGFATGLIVGLFQDALTPNFFGFHMFTRSIIGYTIGLIKDRVFSEEYIAHIPMVGILSMIVKVLAGIILALATASVNFLPWYLLNSVGFAIANMLLTVPIFFLLKKIKHWTEAEKGELFAAVSQEERRRLLTEHKKKHLGLRQKREQHEKFEE